MTQDPIAEYIGELSKALQVEGRRRGRIIREIHDHLLAAAQEEEAKGVEWRQARQLAVDRFGSAEEVAARFGTSPSARVWAALFSRSPDRGIFTLILLSFAVGVPVMVLIPPVPFLAVPIGFPLGLLIAFPIIRLAMIGSRKHAEAGFPMIRGWPGQTLPWLVVAAAVLAGAFGKRSPSQVVFGGVATLFVPAWVKAVALVRSPRPSVGWKAKIWDSLDAVAHPVRRGILESALALWIISFPLLMGGFSGFRLRLSLLMALAWAVITFLYVQSHRRAAREAIRLSQR